jgi:CelD/BcsL family acetyltransferase involved in cellulose biosynthesis
LLSKGHQFDWQQQLIDAQLTSFEVHACPESHPLFTALFFQSPSYLADLRGDTTVSYEARLAAQHRTIARQKQKDRKLSRQVGPIRLEFDCQNSQLVEKLMDWKSQQYQRTHIGDIFQLAWVRKLILGLHAMRSAPLRGLLSVLFAGNVPVAMHFGLLEKNLLHYWYPVYEPRYGYGSPGTRLFLEIARRCPEHGIETIDLGYGYQPYKEILCNQKSLSGIGLVSNSRWAHLKYQAKHHALNCAKKIWFKERLKPIVKKLIPHRDMGRFILPR